jgi:hypothetical protein
MTEPKPLDMVKGYALAVVVGACFWGWVGISTVIALAGRTKRDRQPSG